VHDAIAGINAKDAICLVLVGKTSKADDNRQAVAELRKAGKIGADLAVTLDRLLKSKKPSESSGRRSLESRAAEGLRGAASQAVPGSPGAEFGSKPGWMVHKSSGLAVGLMQFRSTRLPAWLS